MSLAARSIAHPLYVWLLVFCCALGGLWGYLSVGKLEDPVFTLKEALVITPYPGASAAAVAVEVSEVIESAAQRLDEIDTVTSRNVPGLSVVTVEVRDTVDDGALAQVWDDLRDRVDDARPALPPGALPPSVNDDYADVFGLYYGVTAPGYEDGEIHEIATYVRRELLGVDGVANVVLAGLPEEAVFVEPRTRTLANLGVPPDVVLGAVAAADDVLTAGTPTADASSGDARVLRIEAPPGDGTVGRIGSLTFGTGGTTLGLLDVADVTRAPVEEPSQLVRIDGEPAFTLGVAGLSSENIVEVGARVEARFDEILAALPTGVALHPIYEQHRVVDEANRGFAASLGTSVAVVIAVLALFMGWRAAVVVGATLLLTVVATFFFMSVFDVEIERISLGALIIAMGMLVDNAIVVADGMQTGMRRGRSAVDAASETARRTQLPLLGATVIGIMAFSGIGLSPDATGDFLFSLFAVCGVSLLLSWLLALTVTPLLGAELFPVGSPDADDDPYDTRFFRGYAVLVRGALRWRWVVILGLVVLTAACLAAFGSVKQQFFPPANTPIFLVDYKALQGTPIAHTAEDLAALERRALEDPDVVGVATSAGAPHVRFQLTYTPEPPDPSYGQLIVRTTGFEAIAGVRARLDAHAAEALPWAEVRSRRIIFGPPVLADVEVRLSGPDPEVLRALAERAAGLLRAAPDVLQTVRSDWREAELATRPRLATQRARELGIGREDVARAIALATDGQRAGTYRERERLIPIIVRTPREEAVRGAALLDQPVWSPVLSGFVPLAQVVDGFELVARDNVLERRGREPTVSVQADAVDGITVPSAFAEVRAPIEAMALPPGYRMAWGGDHESSTEAQRSLAAQMPLSFGAMLLITVLLFGRLRQTAVIWTIVPMAVNGVAIGLLVTGLPFTFTALLGLLSLAGMLIKNAIVLVEEIDLQKGEEGLAQSEAIVVASVSRLRPVVLAAATTILGMVPLVGDAFFASMAVAIMAGLGFASVLTLVGVPVLYHTYLRRERLAEGEPNDHRSRSSRLRLRARPA